jgi:hypothetical protein
METAQDTYKRLHLEYLAPAFRDLDLRGSKNYLLPDEHYWLQIGFQGSDSSSAEAVRFYINLSAHDKQEWQEFRARSPLMRPSARPAPNMHWPVGKLQRLGILMTQRNDKRWELRAGQELAELAAEVKAAVRDYGIPWLRSQTRPEGIAGS